jgi:hypothetical protein
VIDSAILDVDCDGGGFQSPGTKKTERKELMLDDIFTDRKLYSEFQSYLVSKYFPSLLQFFIL